MTDRVEKTERFLRERLGRENPYYTEHPEMRTYRLEHTFRVARIGAAIARAEGMDEEAMTIACLLHDVSYYLLIEDADWREHGRLSAQIARPFLEELGLDGGVIGEICYGIAIHVDDRADFPGERTAFALTIGDADNIDRFDVYRLYETLEHAGFSKMPLAEKRAYVDGTRKRLEGFLATAFATPTATALWQERVRYYLDFYRRLGEQLSASVGYLDGPSDCAGPGCGADDLRIGLSGRF